MIRNIRAVDTWQNCPTPILPANAERFICGGNKCRVKCQPGFYPTGKQRVKCRLNSSLGNFWTSSFNPCATCSDLPTSDFQSNCSVNSSGAKKCDLSCPADELLSVNNDLGDSKTLKCRCRRADSFQCSWFKLNLQKVNLSKIRCISNPDFTTTTSVPETTTTEACEQIGFHDESNNVVCCSQIPNWAASDFANGNCFGAHVTTTTTTTSTTTTTTSSTTTTTTTTEEPATTSVLETTETTTSPFTFESLSDLIPSGLMTCSNIENGFSGNRGQRIFNGAEADPNSWPWIVNMFFQTETQMDQGGASICGGTIVHSNWVLTAAHCCEEKSRVFGRFGQHNMNGGDEGEFTLSSQNFIIHPGRTENARNNDFCLVKFDNSITEAGDENCAGNCVGIACLPSSPVSSGKACWAAGWGVTELNNLSSNLLSVGLNHLPLDYCLDKSHYFASQISSDNFCAGLPDFDGDGETDPGKDTCQGDSGGPLVCAVDGKVVLTGVTSWGAECAFAGRPGVYGDVFFVRTWITSIINNN